MGRGACREGERGVYEAMEGPVEKEAGVGEGETCRAGERVL